MKNHLLLLVALFIAIKSDAQTNYNLAIKKCVKYTDTSGMLNKYLRKIDTANIRFRPIAGSNIKLTGTYPNITIESAASGAADTSSLSNRINTKLNITDTANIRFRPVAGSNITLSGTYPNITIAASGGGGSTDTTSLSNRINAKLNITDTANIRFRPVAGSNITLSGTYPNITIAASGGGGSTDTTSLSNRINTKLNITDTANIRFRPVAGSNITLSGTYPNISIAETKWSTDSNTSIYIGSSSSTYSSTYTGTINFPDVNGTANSGISFGGSGYNCNLYRPNASYLRTDNGFLVGTTFYVGNTNNKWTEANGLQLNPTSVISGSSSALQINQTWNTTGVPTLISANVTNTQSGSTSNLINLQVSNVSRFRVDKNGAVTVNNASQIISGTGSPEGVVTAGVGSMYLRTDGGAGTTLYIKETGTGATGWAAK